jgi:hypothetical protein
MAAIVDIEALARNAQEMAKRAHAAGATLESMLMAAGLYRAAEGKHVGLVISASREIKTNHLMVSVGGLSRQLVHHWNVAIEPGDVKTGSLEAPVFDTPSGPSDNDIAHGRVHRQCCIYKGTADVTMLWLCAMDKYDKPIDAAWHVPPTYGDKSTTLHLLPSVRRGWVPIIPVESLEKNSCNLEEEEEEGGSETKTNNACVTPTRPKARRLAPNAPARMSGRRLEGAVATEAATRAARQRRHALVVDTQ